MQINKDMTSSASELYQNQVAVLRSVLVDTEKKADAAEAKLFEADVNFQAFYSSFNA
jgi:hypothetical protein